MTTKEQLKERLDTLLAENPQNKKEIEAVQRQYDCYCRNAKITNGEVFTLEEIRECQRLIQDKYPQYKEPITADSGIIFAVEAIRKSCGSKIYLPLYKYSIKIDLGGEEIYEVDPGNFVTYHKK